MNELVEQHPQLDLFPIKEVEIDGIQMGVLNDGTPYLTARGLALMCGIDNSVLIRMANNWQEEKSKPRGKKIAALLANQGYSGLGHYLRAVGNGGESHAYYESECIAVLVDYAYDTETAS